MENISKLWGDNRPLMETIEENLELILRMLKMIGSTWREARRLEKNWHDNLDKQEGLALS